MTSLSSAAQYIGKHCSPPLFIFLYLCFFSVPLLLGRRGLGFPPSSHQLYEAAWGWPAWPSGPAAEGSGETEIERGIERQVQNDGVHVGWRES